MDQRVNFRVTVNPVPTTHPVPKREILTRCSGPMHAKMRNRLLYLGPNYLRDAASGNMNVTGKAGQQLIIIGKEIPERRYLSNSDGYEQSILRV